LFGFRNKFRILVRCRSRRPKIWVACLPLPVFLTNNTPSSAKRAGVRFGWLSGVGDGLYGKGVNFPAPAVAYLLVFSA